MMRVDGSGMRKLLDDAPRDRTAFLVARRKTDRLSIRSERQLADLDDPSRWQRPDSGQPREGGDDASHLVAGRTNDRGGRHGGSARADRARRERKCGEDEPAPGTRRQARADHHRMVGRRPDARRREYSRLCRRSRLRDVRSEDGFSGHGDEKCAGRLRRSIPARAAVGDRRYTQRRSLADRSRRRRAEIVAAQPGRRESTCSPRSRKTPGPCTSPASARTPTSGWRRLRDVDHVPRSRRGRLLVVRRLADEGLAPSTPSRRGMDRAALEAFDRELAAGKYGYVDSMLVIRHGKVVYEKTYDRSDGLRAPLRRQGRARASTTTTTRAGTRTTRARSSTRCSPCRRA